jgi:tripartite-type tricarboxylate transporter receptor subunit TctC
MTKTKMTHVAYRGNVPAMTDVMAGAVQFMFTDLGSAEPMAEAGKLRVLAVSTTERVGSSPNIPTVAEAGVPGYSAESWQMLVAPAHTPKVIVDKLNEAINAIIATPQVREQMMRARTVPIGKGSPDELLKFTFSEISRWGNVIKDAGLAGTQ